MFITPVWRCEGRNCTKNQNCTKKRSGATHGPLRDFFDLAVDGENEPTYPIATVDGTDDVTIVLLVSARSTELESHAHALRTDGHEVVEATSFEQARALLSSLRPDLLVTSIQLGAYNGLHLVWQRHVEQPGRPSIVTSAIPTRCWSRKPPNLDVLF